MTPPQMTRTTTMPRVPGGDAAEAAHPWQASRWTTSGRRAGSAATTQDRLTVAPRGVPSRYEVDPTIHDGGEDVAMSGGHGDIVDGTFDMDVGFIGSLQPSRDDCVAELLLAQLGAGRRHVREHRQAARKMISEIYSPPPHHEGNRERWMEARSSRVRARPNGHRPTRRLSLGLQPARQAPKGLGATT